MDIDYQGPEFITWQISNRVGAAHHKASLAGKERPEVQAAVADAEAALERACQILEEFRAGRLTREEARSNLHKEHRIASSAAWTGSIR